MGPALGRVLSQSIISVPMARTKLAKSLSPLEAADSFHRRKPLDATKPEVVHNGEGARPLEVATGGPGGGVSIAATGGVRLDQSAHGQVHRDVAEVGTRGPWHFRPWEELKQIRRPVGLMGDSDSAASAGVEPRVDIHVPRGVDGDVEQDGGLVT
jgi:hypothetical protein